MSIFLPTYLVLSAGVCTAFLAGDLFNLYVGFEVLLSASFVLLTIAPARNGSCRHLLRDGVDGVVADLPDRIGTDLSNDRTLNMAELSLRLQEVTTGTRSAIFAVLLVAFGIKSGGVPAVGVAAGFLSHRAGPGHCGVRRLLTKCRRVRDHPGALAAVPAAAWTTCCWSRRC